MPGIVPSALHCAAVRRGLPLVVAIAVLASAVAGSAAAGAPNVQAAGLRRRELGRRVDARGSPRRRAASGGEHHQADDRTRGAKGARSRRGRGGAARRDAVGESSLFLRSGQRISVRDLLIGTLVPSANDAATTLAYRAGEGSVDRFVARMNATARELGLTGTRYRNPHGLDQAGHVSTARDVARLLRVALRDPFIRRYAGVRSGGPLERDGRDLDRQPLRRRARVPRREDRAHRRGRMVSGRCRAPRRGRDHRRRPRRHERGSARRAISQRSSATASLPYRPSHVVDPARVYASVEVGWGRAPVGLVARREVVRPAPTGRPLVERVEAPVTVALPGARPARASARVVVLDGDRVVARAPLVAARSVERPGRLARAAYVARRDRASSAGLGHLDDPDRHSQRRSRPFRHRPDLPRRASSPGERRRHPRGRQGHQRGPGSEGARRPGGRVGARRRAHGDAHRRGADRRGDPQRLRAHP